MSRAIRATKAEDQVVLPPPSAFNPVPALPAALRIHNDEILLNFLQAIPGRQLLVFSSQDLRLLLLRQVLSDPHARVFKGKKNWDSEHFFPLPRNLQIAGTKVLTDADNDWNQAFDVSTYFLHASSPDETMQICKIIKACKTRTHHRIAYLPQATALCHKIMSNAGISALPNVTIHRLQMDLFPLESDLLSLEYPLALKEATVEQTPSSLVTTVARSLLKLQDVVGTIPRVQALGPLGEQVTRKLLTMRLEEHLGGNVVVEQTTSDTVAAMIVLDRKVDLLTPMLTPLTYEGLLDDIVGVDLGFLHTNIQVLNPEEAEAEQVSLAVNGSDSLFAEVRDQHVEKFGSFLQNQAKALQESHANFTNKEKKKDLNEIHSFVKQIPIFTKNLRALTNHIHLAELVKATTKDSTFREKWTTERAMLEGELCYEVLEDLIATQYPPLSLLKLLALQSLTTGGIKSSKYDSIRRDILQTYGYEYLFLLTNLEKAGLVRRREWMDNAAGFAQLRKSLILIKPDVDPVEPDDISYVSSGYAPLSVRLVQVAVNGWEGKEEMLKELPGRLVDLNQQYPPQDFSTALKSKPSSQKLGALAAGNKKQTIVVCYVGGVTYMEIAALRFLSKRPSFPFHFIVITTKVTNGASLLQSMG